MPRHRYQQTGLGVASLDPPPKRLLSSRVVEEQEKRRSFSTNGKVPETAAQETAENMGSPQEKTKIDLKKKSEHLR